MSEIKITLAAFADEADAELSGQIAAMKRNGLSRIELRNVGRLSCADLTAEMAKEIRARLDDEGMRIETLGSPIGKVKISSDFNAEAERFLRIAETAHLLGASKIRMFSFFRDPEWEEERGQTTALEYLSRLSEQAGDLMLCHENEKDIYGDGYEFCLSICKNVPKIRAVFDPSNFVQCGVDTAVAWEALKEHVEYLHLKDARADGIVVPCGDGIGNVPAIVEDFIDRGGRFMTLEPHLADFASKKYLEKEEYKTCGYAFDDTNEAFDAAVAAVRKILNKKGAIAQ